MNLYKQHCSANPAMNLFCHCKLDATNTVFLDTTAGDGGETVTQLFIGCHMKLVSVHPVKGTDKYSILGAFQDCVYWHGATDEL